MANELTEARKAVPFDTKGITAAIHRPGQRERRDKVLRIIEKETLFDKEGRNLNHNQLMRRGLAISRRLLELRREHSWDENEWREAIFLQDDPLPITLHESAFIKVIESQGTKEQQEEWLPRCHRYEIIGGYCQTELAHGSNVQGLETEAKWDNTKKGFIIHSPRLESTKWWIGGVGVLATHAVVQAILKFPASDGVNKWQSVGPHLFIVQLRDLETHKPMPGVKVGDIGPKAYGSFAKMDNGYVVFDKVFVPRNQLLMRNSKVTEDGTYVPAKHDKLTYGSMVFLRTMIPESIGWALARAVTISTRYTSVRRQFADKKSDDPLEKQVITYASVRHRLGPLLANAFAYIISGQELVRQYEVMMKRLLAEDDFELLAEVHVLSSALKAVVTWDGVQGMEEARKAMGGHGFSVYGGVSHLFAAACPSQTFEGDNFVIAQQTSRALLKFSQLLLEYPEHKLPESLSYLRLLVAGNNNNASKTASKVAVTGANDWLNPQVQIDTLAHRAAALVERLGKGVASGKIKDVSWESAAVTRAHANLFLVQSFWKFIDRINPSCPMVKRYLTLTANLYGLSTVLSPQNVADLFELGYFTKESVSLLREAYEEVLSQVGKPEVLIGLTDGFAFSDFELGSSLGCFDGNVYERLWNSVRKEEMRAEMAGENWGADVRKITGWWREQGAKEKSKL